MQDNYIFEYADLNHDEILCPEQFMEDFAGCAMYAKGTLTNRNKEEIVITMKELDMEINKASDYDFPALYFVNKIPKLTLDSIRTCTNRFGIITIMRLHSNDDMSSLTHKNNLTWADIYSIYTLGLIAYVNRDLMIYENSDGSNKGEHLFELAGYYLAEVVEISTMARLLAFDVLHADEMKKIIVKSQESKAKIAKLGGAAKNEKYRLLEKTVIKEYIEHHSHKTNRQAGIDIWQRLPSDIKLDSAENSILKDHNADQTVARWIATHKRQTTKT